MSDREPETIPFIQDDCGWHHDDRLVREAEEIPQQPPAPKPVRVYFFESDSFQVRYMHGGRLVSEGNTWTDLKSATEAARDAMESYGVTPASTMAIEIVRTVHCKKRIKTREKITWGSHEGEPVYKQVGYSREVKSEIVWRSTAPDETCCIPLETHTPCGEEP